MWTLYIRLATMIVEQIFIRIPGQAYETPAGHIMVDVPRNTYVGKGFVATAPAEAGGTWTFAPPPVDEEPPTPSTLPEEIGALKAAAAALNDRIASLEALAVGG